MYLEKYMRSHESLKATQYFLSAPNYFVYSKIFLLVQRSLTVSYVSGQCFVAYLIGVSVRNKFYIRTEERASHISQYEGQLHDQDQAWGSECEPPTSALKKPDVAPCSRNTSTGEAEQTAPGSLLASQSNYTTVVSNAVWPYLQEIRWRSWKNTPWSRVFTAITEDLNLLPFNSGSKCVSTLFWHSRALHRRGNKEAWGDGWKGEKNL